MSLTYSAYTPSPYGMPPGRQANPFCAAPQYIPVNQPPPAMAVPQFTPPQVMKEVVHVPVPQPFPVEVVKEVEVAPVVHQNVTLYQPRPEPSLTVCQYPREFYYVENKAEARVEEDAKVVSRSAKTLKLRVAHGDDDCEQKLSTGKTSLHDDDLDLREGRLVGIRFQNVQIRPRQQVTAARLFFYSKLDKSDDCKVEIFGDASGDAAPFTHELNSVGQRPQTHATVHWSVPHWIPMSPDESPELARIVQEVVNSPNWHFGGSLAFLLHGTSGHRSAWAFDGNPSLAPSLVLQVVEEEEHVVASSPSHESPYRSPVGSSSPFRGSPDFHDGYNAHGFQRSTGTQGDPWNLPRYAHLDQAHADPPRHNQTAHLIYEDKFRYPRYNLSHECLRPTRLERQIPESARPLFAAAGVQAGAHAGFGLRALEAPEPVDLRFSALPLPPPFPGAGPSFAHLTRL
eukprot:TRINITY_DN1733_c0_g1_i1.p1 TRINITY_DN1733_c0_g1~~TRINITY_DN1733_c0_g1_i1.p1  ORF type:complete len:465 (+),score=68.18 TRINITY_DN1733_c0_g1_i1:28-1395(+)